MVVLRGTHQNRDSHQLQKRKVIGAVSEPHSVKARIDSPVCLDENGNRDTFTAMSEQVPKPPAPYRGQASGARGLYDLLSR
jgi:hypothetical protein